MMRGRLLLPVLVVLICVVGHGHARAQSPPAGVANPVLTTAAVVTGERPLLSLTQYDITFTITNKGGVPAVSSDIGTMAIGRTTGSPIVATSGRHMMAVVNFDDRDKITITSGPTVSSAEVRREVRGRPRPTS